MKVLIVDDESPARQRLQLMLDEMPGIEQVDQAANGREALHYCHESSPDVVLLDIRMPGMDGIEVAMHLLSQTHQAPAVIFTTAFGEHALAAFDVQAVDYLLKPIRRERLQQALERATQLNQAQIVAMQQQLGPTAARNHLCIRHGDRLELIAISDIAYFEADQKYVSVWHHDGESLIDESLKALEQEFGEQFIRIHRNALVARHRLVGLDKTSDGGFAAVLDGVAEPLEISRRNVAAVRKLLKQMT
jgi:two-component system response regulator AlgR